MKILGFPLKDIWIYKSILPIFIAMCMRRTGIMGLQQRSTIVTVWLH